jgi:hypothetical protein
MSKRLKFVRKDSEFVVLTEHPDHIHPRDLSNSLERLYGQNHFRISLRRNIYVVYIDTRVVRDDYVSETMRSQEAVSNGDALNQDSIPAATDVDQRKQRLLDIKLAEEVLREAKLSKSRTTEVGGV